MFLRTSICRMISNTAITTISYRQTKVERKYYMYISEQNSISWKIYIYIAFHVILKQSGITHKNGNYILILFFSSLFFKVWHYITF